jgi:hypothetical protein
VQLRRVEDENSRLGGNAGPVKNEREADRNYVRERMAANGYYYAHSTVNR